MLGDLQRPDDGPLLRTVLLDFDEVHRVRILARHALQQVGGTLTAEELPPLLAGLSRDVDNAPGAAIAYLVPLAADQHAREVIDTAFRQLDPKARIDAVLMSSHSIRTWARARVPAAHEVSDELLPTLFRGMHGSDREAAFLALPVSRIVRLEQPILEHLVDLLAHTEALVALARDQPLVNAAALARLALPLPHLIDALGEDGLMSSLRAVFTRPGRGSADYRLISAAKERLVSCGPAGVALARSLLEVPGHEQTSKLVDLVTSTTPDALIARALALLEAERDLPLVDAVVRHLAKHPSEVGRDLLVRALKVPSLRGSAFNGLATMDRGDPTWNERALTLAGDDPVLVARAHAHRARAGDIASRDTLFDLAFTGPSEAREVALQALSGLAPERRDIFRRVLAEPRPACGYGCCDKLGMLSVLVLKRGATPEDVAVMTEAHLTGPQALEIASALTALWTNTPA